MANLKELRGRIASVGNISQITKAMEMVASMKLRKVQARALAHHPYSQEVRGMILRLAQHTSHADRPLFLHREVNTTGVLLLTSDRGLCGSFNTNLLGELTKLREQAAAEGRQLKYFCYGRKGYSWLTRRGFEVERFFVEPQLDKADFQAARMVADALGTAFLSGTVDEVRVCYTRFLSAARFSPTIEQFLPIDDIIPPTGAAADDGVVLDFLMEPTATAVFDALVPRYLETVAFDAMLQSLASEHASRRMAMKGATDAAGRMTKELRKVYNRARQESITKELLDIVGGAEAIA